MEGVTGGMWKRDRADGRGWESKDDMSHMGCVLQQRCMGMPQILQSSQQDNSAREDASWAVWSPQNHVKGEGKAQVPSTHMPP